jgi:DNA-directed RNA polymerase subunit RPC12/RpoP
MNKRDIGFHKPGVPLLKQAHRPSFRCAHCRREIPTQALGTKNRNHCPYCLWSRHVDEAVGDRKSKCLAAMRAVGLTLKTDGGELMVVHMCTQCPKISKNRIAGDDLDTALLDLLEESKALDNVARGLVSDQGIPLCQDAALVREQVYGKNVG